MDFHSLKRISKRMLMFGVGKSSQPLKPFHPVNFISRADATVVFTARSAAAPVKSINGGLMWVLKTCDVFNPLLRQAINI